MKKPRQRSSPNRAAALKYDGVNAPTLIAKGQGAVAEQILALAEKHSVHIHKDPVLLEVLSKLELGDEIPEVLYLAVAKIIAFAYFLQGKHPDYVPSPQTEETAIEQIAHKNGQFLTKE